MAYDSVRQRAVLFGGMASWGAFAGETWEWDGAAWQYMNPAIRPASRRGHALAFDESRQRVVLFGGDMTGSSFLADTWEWDGTAWFPMTPANSPPGRMWHAMVYDAARQRTILFGGSGFQTAFGDTWEWDGVNWVPRFSASFPPARQGHAMTYDPVRQRVVMCGGMAVGNALFGDTWEWDGLTWLAKAAAPSPRQWHALAFDPSTQRTLLFGGMTANSPSPVASNDTWEWDGSMWSPRNMANAPAARWGHAMVSETALQRVLLFGGGTFAQGFADTWVSGLVGTPGVAVTYGSGCGSPSPSLVPDPSHRPISGASGGASILGAPTNIGALMIGFSNVFHGPFQLPVTLAGLGMPSCDLWQSAEIMGFPASPASASSMAVSVFIPSSPSLVGAHVYLQGYVFAPGVNQLGIAVTNGLDWLVGDV